MAKYMNIVQLEIRNYKQVIMDSVEVGARKDVIALLRMCPLFQFMYMHHGH